MSSVFRSAARLNHDGANQLARGNLGHALALFREALQTMLLHPPQLADSSVVPESLQAFAARGIRRIQLSDKKTGAVLEGARSPFS